MIRTLRALALCPMVRSIGAPAPGCAPGAFGYAAGRGMARDSSGYAAFHDNIRAAVFSAPGRALRALAVFAVQMLMVWIVAAPASWAQTYALHGRVVHVADGDTLTLLSARREVRVRLASIDAPETGHGRMRPGQPFGQAAKRALSDLVAGRELDLRCYEKDQYDREICDVFLPDGDTANQVMVSRGLAWANQQGGGKYLRDRRLLRLESDAKKARRGLWQDSLPVAPWEWRWRCWQVLESGKTTPIC